MHNRKEGNVTANRGRYFSPNETASRAGPHSSHHQSKSIRFDIDHIEPCERHQSLTTPSSTARSTTNTLSQGLEKIQAAREYDFAPVLALSSIWEKEFLAPSMARSAVEAFNMVCCLDRNGKLDDSAQDKKQKAATTLLRDGFYGQDFAGPISLRASRVLGPTSRFRVVETLPHTKLACFSSWTYRCFLTHHLQRAVYCTKISH